MKMDTVPPKLIEAAEFKDALAGLFEEFYYYMHGDDRQEEGKAEMLLQRYARFYDADWIGLIDIDLTMGRWSANCFYNAVTGSTTQTLIQDIETASIADTWVKAIKSKTPIIVENIEDIREELPTEYILYKRLEVQSILAIPYRNVHSGLMVVKNARRFKKEYAALNVMSYIVTHEIISKKRRDNAMRKAAPGMPENNTDVYIKLFGDLEICSKDLCIRREDIKAERLRFLIAYLALSKRAASAGKLSDVYYNSGDDKEWKNLVYKFRKTWTNMRTIDEDEYQLLITSDNGYRFNPNLHIVTDADGAEDLLRAIDDTADVKSKKELLMQLFALFRGNFMQGDDDCDWILEMRREYRRRYLERMDQLMQLLYDENDLQGIQHYATDVLKKFPRSVDMHYWLIVALHELGLNDFARSVADDSSAMDKAETVILYDRLESYSQKQKRKQTELFFKHSSAMSDSMMSIFCDRGRRYVYNQ